MCSAPNPEPNPTPGISITQLDTAPTFPHPEQLHCPLSKSCQHLEPVTLSTEFMVLPKWLSKSSNSQLWKKSVLLKNDTKHILRLKRKQIFRFFDFIFGLCLAVIPEDVQFSYWAFQPWPCSRVFPLRLHHPWWPLKTIHFYSFSASPISPPH